MKYANQLSEMINVFSSAPLQMEQMAEYYCEDMWNFVQVISTILRLKIFSISAGIWKNVVHVCCWGIEGVERGQS